MRGARSRLKTRPVAAAPSPNSSGSAGVGQFMVLGERAQSPSAAKYSTTTVCTAACAHSRSDGTARLAARVSRMTAAKYQEAERSRRALSARRCASKPGASSLHSFDMDERLALELAGGGEPELGLDVLAVGADGLGAQPKLGGDLARAAAGPDQEEDLHLAIGQLGIAALRRAVKSSREDAGVHARAEHDLAAHERRQRLDDAVQFLPLHQIAARTRRQHALGVERLVVLRQHQHARRGSGPQALRHEVRAAAPAQHQVEDHEIRPLARGKLECLDRRAGFAADVVAAGLLDHRAQAHPHHRMVIDDQDARPLRCHGGELAWIVASQSRQPRTTEPPAGSAHKPLGQWASLPYPAAMLGVATHPDQTNRDELWPGRHAMRRVSIAAALSVALLATADAKEQRGTIISVDDAAKTFVCQWGTKDWTYKTTKKTGIRISNRDGGWSDLKTGARVNVGYHTVGEDRVAELVVRPRSASVAARDR